MVDYFGALGGGGGRGGGAEEQHQNKLGTENSTASLLVIS